MKKSTGFVLLLAWGLWGPLPSLAADQSARLLSPVVISHRPPTAKDVLEAAMASSLVPLTVSPTCRNVGTEPTDATLGRYLAGFLAEMTSSNKSNWVETQIEVSQSPGGVPTWRCQLMLRHENGDDRWGWGLQFHVVQSTGLVLKESFRCLGAG